MKIIRHINEDEGFVGSPSVDTLETEQGPSSTLHSDSTDQEYFVPLPPQQKAPSHFIKDQPLTQKLCRKENEVHHQKQLNIAKSVKVVCSLDLLLQYYLRRNADILHVINLQLLLIL